MADDKSLKGLKVLVTRPAKQARQLCKLIANAGGQPVAFPLIKIEPLPPQNWNDAPLTEYEMIIFVSQYAVSYFVAGLSQPLTTATRLAAVGPATASAMHDADLSVDIVPPGAEGSESLLKIAELNNVANKKIAIVRGQDGRNFLAYQLRGRGAKISYIEVYKRRMTTPTNADINKAKTVDCLIVTSGGGLDNLCALIADKDFKKKWLIVASNRIKQYALKLGFTRILVSDAASDAAIMRQINIAGKMNGKR